MDFAYFILGIRDRLRWGGILIILSMVIMCVLMVIQCLLLKVDGMKMGSW